MTPATSRTPTRRRRASTRSSRTARVALRARLADPHDQSGPLGAGPQRDGGDEVTADVPFGERPLEPVPHDLVGLHRTVTGDQRAVGPVDGQDVVADRWPG